jgi:hypothetical protein
MHEVGLRAEQFVERGLGCAGLVDDGVDAVALMPFLQNRCVAALSRRSCADSSSLAATLEVLFKDELRALAMAPRYANRGVVIKSHLRCAQNNR